MINTGMDLEIFSKLVTGYPVSMIGQFEHIERHDKGKSNGSDSSPNEVDYVGVREAGRG